MLKQALVVLAGLAIASSAYGAAKKVHRQSTSTPVQAAQPPAPISPPWEITPNKQSCNANLKLTGLSGALTQVALVSDGEHTILMFTKDEIAEKAFLPLLVDHKPYSNLVQRLPNPKFGAMTLSDDSLAALRHGGTLQIDWLASEPITMPLGAADQGLTDLTICGKQVFGQFQAAQAAAATQKAQIEAAERNKAESDARIAAAKAQQRAAETQRRRAAAADLDSFVSGAPASAPGSIQTRTYVLPGGNIVNCTALPGVTTCN